MYICMYVSIYIYIYIYIYVYMLSVDTARRDTLPSFYHCCSVPESLQDPLKTICLKESNKQRIIKKNKKRKGK